jgi:hypothetical protein
MATASLIHGVLNLLNISINTRNMCVFLAPLFAANTAVATYLFTIEVCTTRGVCWSVCWGMCGCECVDGCVDGWVCGCVGGGGWCWCVWCWCVWVCVGGWGRLGDGGVCTLGVVQLSACACAPGICCPLSRAVPPATFLAALPRVHLCLGACACAGS